MPAGSTRSSLKSVGGKQGEKRTLSAEQEQELTALLVDHDPAQLKLKGCMWMRDSVKELIQQKYGITMPNRTVGECLSRWGFTVQRPISVKVIEQEH